MNQKYTVKQTELSDDLSEKRTFTSQTNPATDLYIFLINYMVTRDLKSVRRFKTQHPSSLLCGNLMSNHVAKSNIMPQTAIEYNNNQLGNYGNVFKMNNTLSFINFRAVNKM